MKKAFLSLALMWFVVELYRDPVVRFYRTNAHTIRVVLIAAAILAIMFLPQRVFQYVFDLYRNFHTYKRGGGGGGGGSTGGRASGGLRGINGYMKKWVAAKQEWRCGECKLLLEAAYEVDHVVPLAAGGSNDESNLRALCRRCHGVKTFRERL